MLSVHKRINSLFNQNKLVTRNYLLVTEKK